MEKYDFSKREDQEVFNDLSDAEKDALLIKARDEALSDIEKVTEKIFFKLLLLESMKVDEGNNAIIKVFNQDNLSDEAREYFLKSKPDLFKTNEKAAVKVLKIYLNGSGEREFEAHQKASELLDSEDGVALVPQVYFYRDIDIDDLNLSKKLSSEGVQLKEGGKAEMIVMDYIEGINLADYIYKLVLKCAQNDISSKNKGLVIFQRENIDELSQKDLHDAVSKLCEFSKPGGKHSNEADKKREERIVESGNTRNLKNYLIKNKLSIPDELFQVLRRTIDMLHSKGFYHRDLHEKNIMIGNNGELYILDFGTSIDINEDGNKVSREDVYVKDGSTNTNYTEDDYMLKMWLAVSDKNKLTDMQVNEKKELNEVYQKISKFGTWTKFCNIIDGIDEKNASSVVDRFARIFADQDYGYFYEKVKIILINELIENSKNGKEIKKALEDRR